MLWSLLPILLRANLPMDTAEAWVWGSLGEWGTNKHPPLSGWLAYGAWFLAGKNPCGIYCLSALLTAGGMLYVYRLGKCFLSEGQALAAAVLLEGVAYYNYVIPEYNCNIVALFLWPACSFYFYRGIKDNLWGDWLLFGGLAGANILNKYVSGALLVGLGGYMLFTKAGRARLSSGRVYVAAALGLALTLPHWVWLYNRDFFVLEYFARRSSAGGVMPYGMGHIVYTAKFIGAQVLAGLAMLAALVWLRKRASKEPMMAKPERQFAFWAGICPMLIMALVPLVSGVKLKSMWGSPAEYMLGICYMVWLPFKVNEGKVMRTAYGLLGAFSLVFAAQTELTLSAKFNLDAKDFVRNVGGDEAKYVGGSVWLASILGVYGSAAPEVIFEMDADINPWIDINKAKREGILAVEECRAAYAAHRRDFADLPEPMEYVWQAKNIWGQTKEYRFFYGKTEKK